MTAQTATQNSSIDGAVATLAARDYTYLGEDNQGEHHHYDEDANTIYVTSGGHEQFTPERTTRPHYRILGDVVRVVDLNNPDLEDKDEETWTKYVADRRGWANRPESPLRKIAGVLHDSDLVGR